MFDSRKHWVASPRLWDEALNKKAASFLNWVVAQSKKADTPRLQEDARKKKAVALKRGADDLWFREDNSGFKSS